MFVETMTLGEAASNTEKRTGHQLHEIFSTICLIPSCLPNTNNVKKEEQRDVLTTDHFSKMGLGEVDKKSTHSFQISWT